MGTPEFAVASLDALIKANFNVAGVVTSPDKPAGRGLNPQASAVKQYAVEKGLKFLQPEKLKSPEFLRQLAELEADIQVVVAFRMLPEVVWNMPRMGTINVHASLLPNYRGAAPINWAIINGEKQTGVTTFKLKHEIDTGDILLQDKISIEEKETAGELHDKLKILGAELLVKTLHQLAEEKLSEKAQSEITESGVELKHASKIFTDTCLINWQKSAAEINNLIRGLSPHPAAYTHLNGKKLKIFRSEKDYFTHNDQPGSFKTDEKTLLKFACADGFLMIKELQLEGKKKMRVEDFLRGYKF